MAVSQGWSDWAGRWFDGKGKILHVTVTIWRRVWPTAQTAVFWQPRAAVRTVRPQIWYH